ncbi:hypothetical protein DR64_8650 [Paraburkholderia xenovorans LB400]|nr:hypothetical protein DR64_8650 [Paraburkholderia xenovorans LB400]
MNVTRTPKRLFGWLSRLACVACVCSANPAGANVVITGTRVIYPAAEREVTVKLTNNGDLPSLVQVWVDKGDSKAAPDKIDATFILTPPVARIEPHKGQTLRLTYTGDALPQDKESVFWLNVLDIPPKPAAPADDAANLLQVAIRTRIKIFFRPVGLTDEGAREAVNAVAWKLVSAGSQGAYAIRATNASAYHVNVAGVQIRSGGHEYTIKEGAMIAPGASRSFEFSERLSTLVPDGTEFDFTVVNDAGGFVPVKARIGAYSQ